MVYQFRFRERPREPWQLIPAASVDRERIEDAAVTLRGLLMAHRMFEAEVEVLNIEGEEAPSRTHRETEERQVSSLIPYRQESGNV